MQTVKKRQALAKAALIANGAIRDYPCIKQQLSAFDKIIAVDGGLHHCSQMDICPDAIIGDLDSIAPHLLEKYHHVPVFRYPAEKDETDLEIAVRLIKEEGFQQIVLFAALENRTDHALNNLYLLSRYPQLLSIASEKEDIRVIQGSYSLFHCLGKQLSLLPIGEPVTGVTTKGLKWELDNCCLDQKMMSISNVCVADQVSISITSGDVLLCLQKAS